MHLIVTIENRIINGHYRVHPQVRPLRVRAISVPGSPPEEHSPNHFQVIIIYNLKGLDHPSIKA